MSASRRLTILVAALGAACAPPSQIVLHVDTDAPVPAAAGAKPDPQRPRWLFDRLRIEVLQGGAVVARRDFAVDEALFQAGRASFGITPAASDDPVAVRARLFRGDRLGDDGEPPAAAAIDTVVKVGPLTAPGVAHRTVRLRVDDVGQPRGSATAPVDAEVGEPGPSSVGSWPGARVVGCAAPATRQEACVPGGAFWMGDPALRGFPSQRSAERLVVVSPFLLDLAEVSVLSYRKQAAILAAMGVAPPTEYMAPYFCNYTAKPQQVAPDVDEPVNCVSWATARAYCQLLGRDLPTEAQLEFAASGRGDERAYAWGSDEPGCYDAAFGRAWQRPDGESECIPDFVVPGPARPGTGRRDRVSFVDPAGKSWEVLDLAGNVAELTRDLYSTPDEAYWSRPGLFVDPVADVESPSLGPGYLVHGGSWSDARSRLRAATRGFTYPFPGTHSIGFRCALTSRPTDAP